LINKNVVAFVVTFCIVFVFNNLNVFSGLSLLDESGLAQTQQGYDESLERSMPNFAGIYSLKIPEPKADIEQWRAFFMDIGRIPREDLVGYKGKKRPMWVFLSYFAKYQPALFIEYVDSGEITISDFDSIVQKGLLQDWYTHSSNVNQIIRNGRMALLRFGVNEGADKANDIAKRAFLEIGGIVGEVTINVTNLRFALNTMADDERSRMAEILLNSNVRFDRDKVLLLNGFYSKSDLLAISENQASKEKSWQNSYEVAEALWGNSAALDSMVTEFTNATLLAAGELDKGDRGWQRRYCVPCALAISSDGLVGKPLYEAANSGKLQIAQINGQLILGINDEGFSHVE
jgi:hypothetical protein